MNDKMRRLDRSYDKCCSEYSYYKDKIDAFDKVCDKVDWQRWPILWSGILEMDYSGEIGYDDKAMLAIMQAKIYWTIEYRRIFGKYHLVDLLNGHFAHFKEFKLRLQMAKRGEYLNLANISEDFFDTKCEILDKRDLKDVSLDECYFEVKNNTTVNRALSVLSRQQYKIYAITPMLADLGESKIWSELEMFCAKAKAPIWDAYIGLIDTSNKTYSDEEELKKELMAYVNDNY